MWNELNFIDFLNYWGLLVPVNGGCVFRQDLFSYEPFRIFHLKRFHAERVPGEPIELLQTIYVHLRVLLSNFWSFHSSGSRLLGLLLRQVMGRLRKQTGIEILWWWPRLGLHDNSYYKNQTRKLCHVLYEGVCAACRVWCSAMQRGKT